jgi:ligand-binding sensor domain-containing protein
MVAGPITIPPFRWRPLLLAALLLSGVATPLRAQAPDLQFRHLSIRDGLSQSIVDAMVQDRRGFVWFVTEDGLNRYDGYRFSVYKHDARDPASLVHNEIKCIHEDRAGILWIGSFSRGLERFDPSTGRFSHFQHDMDAPASLASDIVWSVIEDRQGRLWVGTAEGLDRLDPAAVAFAHLRTAEPGAGPDDVRALLEDRDGALWAGTAGNGLLRLDPATGAVLRFTHDPADPTSLSHDDVRALLQDADGALWVGTRGGGLCRLDPATGSFRRFRHDPRDPRSLGGDLVLALARDARGDLWVGTDGGGSTAWPAAPRSSTATGTIRTAPPAWRAIAFIRY